MKNSVLGSDTYRAHIRHIACDMGDLSSFLRNRSVLVSGGTGLIGSFFVDFLVNRNEEFKDNVSITVVSRSKERAASRFDRLNASVRPAVIEWDGKTEASLPDANYTLHAASTSDPVGFAINPLGTINGCIFATQQLLENTKRSTGGKVLFVSSGEVYGRFDAVGANTVDEAMTNGVIDWMSPRSCYPYGKRIAELMCVCYHRQFGVHATIARPCHVYGPTQLGSDSRAISQFIRNASEGKKIILKSDGSAERVYCYVADAISALLILMNSGNAGEAYNISDLNSLTTVKNAALTCAKISGGTVTFQDASIAEKQGYSSVDRIAMSAQKLMELGWRPRYSLEEGLRTSIKILSEINRNC